MADGAIPLTDGFPPADEAAWRALVEKTLDGASFETRLVSKTYDGIEIQPLYTAANADKPLSEGLRRHPSFDADRAWDIRTPVDHPDPAEADALALADLQGGATSLLVKIDPSGETGVAVASKDDLARALDGVLFDLAPVASDAGYLGPDAAEWLSDLAQSKTLKPHLHLHLDPLSEFARTGASPGPIEAHIAAAARAGAKLTAKTSFLASGHTVHEAGGTEAQEIAVMAAAGLVYVKAATDAGVSIDGALQSVALGVAADAEYFTTIAKFRAARAVWAKIATALSEEAPLAYVEARSSRRMLSILDPWVNMLRLTSAAFGASVGGADAVVLDPFTQPVGRATPFARRQARNIQLVLMEEAHLGRVGDPAGGAWFVETLTGHIARAAWGFFQEIERRGGIVSALSSGFIAEAVGDARAMRMADLKDKKTKILGVTVFRNPDEAKVAIETTDPKPFAKPSHDVARAGPDDTCLPLTPWRAAEAFETSETA